MDHTGIQFEQVAGILRVTEQHQRYAAAAGISVITADCIHVLQLVPPLPLAIP